MTDDIRREVLIGAADMLAEELPTELPADAYVEAVIACCKELQRSHKSRFWPTAAAFREASAPVIQRWRSAVSASKDTAKPFRPKAREPMPVDRQRVAAILADYEDRERAGTLTGVAARILRLRDSLQAAGVIDRYGKPGPNAKTYAEIPE